MVSTNRLYLTMWQLSLTVTLCLCRHALPIWVLPLRTITSDSPVTVNRSRQDISPRVYIASAGLLYIIFSIIYFRLAFLTYCFGRSSPCRTLERDWSLCQNRRPHHACTIQQLHWLPVRRRIKFKIAVLCISRFLVGHRRIWMLTSNCMAVDRGRQNLRSATDRTCFLPRTHNTFGDRSFSTVIYAVVFLSLDVWNS